MKARDVMVSPVITVKPSSSVKEVAKIFLERRISAAPVVDDQGKLIGIISEGDLMHRAEAGTERHRSWWLRLLTAEETLAAEYVKAHARKVADVMTREVITTDPETPLHEIAVLLEKNPSSGYRLYRTADRHRKPRQSHSGGGQRPQRTRNSALRCRHSRQATRGFESARVAGYVPPECHCQRRCR
jgi:CBS domain-containing protein